MIDDEIEKFGDVGDLERVTSFLTDLGFTPLLITLKDGKTIENELAKYKFDLIISDFNIEEGHHGDEVIKTIRGKNIFTEVLFYSSQTDLKAIAEKLLTVDRISFHSQRRGLIEKIESLIELNVSKLLELNATRGLITSETSDLDVIMEGVVMDLVFNKLKLTQEAIDEKVQSYIDDFLKKSPDSFSKKYGELGFEKTFHKIDAYRKWKLFRELLKQMPNDEINKFLETNKTYSDEVIIVRNKFAHAKSMTKDGKLFLAGFGPDGAPFEFDSSQCITIRKSLIAHRENFNQLISHLAS